MIKLEITKKSCNISTHFGKKLPRVPEAVQEHVRALQYWLKNAEPVFDGEVREATKELALEWIASQDGRHSKAWIAAKSGLRGVEPVLDALIEDGSLELRYTTFKRKGGRPGSMRAYFLPEDPRDDYDPVLDARELYDWIEHKGPFKRIHILQHSGLPRDRAEAALTSLIKDGLVTSRSGDLGVHTVP